MLKTKPCSIKSTKTLKFLSENYKLFARPFLPVKFEKITPLMEKTVCHSLSIVHRLWSIV